MSLVDSRLARGSVLRALNFFAQLVVAFFLTPFVVRMLGDRMYGFWTLVGAFIGYYGLLDLGLSLSVQRHIAGALGAGNDHECNRVYATSLVMFAGIGVIVMLASIALAGFSHFFIHDPGDAELFWKVILVMGLSVALEFPFKVFVGILSAQLRFDIATLIQLLTMVVRTILVVIVLELGYRVLSLAWATFLATIPAKLLYVFYSKKIFPTLRFKKSSFTFQTARKLISYSIFAFIERIADQLRFQIDAIVATVYISLSAVTHYRIASLMIIYFRNFVTTVMGVILPVFSRLEGAGDFAGLRKTFFFSTKLATLISGFIAFGFGFWGRPFIERWMGPSYLDAYPLLAVLAVGCIFDLSQCPSPAVLFATSNHRIYSIYCFFEGVTNLVLSLVLVKHYGLLGIALGTFFPMVFFRLVVQPIHVCSVISISYVQYFLCLFKMMLAVAVSLLIPAWVSWKFVVPRYPQLFAVGAVSAGLYCLSIWFLGFNASERVIALNLIRPMLRLKTKGTP